MSTAGYRRDVATLARFLVRSDTIDITRFLYDLQPPKDDPRIDLVIDAQSNSLRELSALQQLIQLSFDAAAVIVSTSGDLPFELPEEQIYEILDGFGVELRLLGLEYGSFWARYSLDPRASQGRRRLLSMAALAGVILTAVASQGLPFILGAALGAPALLDAIITRDDLPVLETFDPNGLPRDVTLHFVPGGVWRYLFTVKSASTTEARIAFLAEVTQLIGVARESEFSERNKRLTVVAVGDLPLDGIAELAKSRGITLEYRKRQ
jgi:hypothetical protein